MRNDWMLDVLADLKRFAQLNGMPTLAEKLGETEMVAALDITSAEEKAWGANGGEIRPGRISGGTGDIRRL